MKILKQIVKNAESTTLANQWVSMAIYPKETVHFNIANFEAKF